MVGNPGSPVSADIILLTASDPSPIRKAIGAGVNDDGKRVRTSIIDWRGPFQGLLIFLSSSSSFPLGAPARDLLLEDAGIIHLNDEKQNMTWYVEYLEVEAMSRKDIVVTILALSTFLSLPKEIQKAKEIGQWIRERGGTPEAAQQIAEAAGKSDPEELTSEDLQQIQQTVQSDRVESEPEETSLPRISDILTSLIRHEDLVEGQLPVRITHPVMRRWNTYLGFPLNQDESRKPANRQNFLFLMNPEDLPAAMAAQFARYQEAPDRFGLPNNPSLGQAIRTFDQQNPDGKMRYIANEVEEVDFSRPLADYL